MPQNNQDLVSHDFFVYQEDFSSLAANASAEGSISIQADSDFMIQKLTYTADIAGAAQTDANRVVPLASILITDSGSGRQLMDSAVPIASMFGDGRLPFILPKPKLFTARSTVSITVTNFSNATTYNLRLSFIGYKIFRYN